MWAAILLCYGLALIMCVTVQPRCCYSPDAVTALIMLLPSKLKRRCITLTLKIIMCVWLYGVLTSNCKKNLFHVLEAVWDLGGNFIQAGFANYIIEYEHLWHQLMATVHIAGWGFFCKQNGCVAFNS